MNRKFTLFEEIEKDLQQNAPSEVFKYRTWQDENHKSLLKDQKIWFSHPFDLNDPLDVRPETSIDLSEVEDPRYLQKLLNTVHSQHPGLITDYDRRTVAENNWEITKNNPTMIIDHHEELMTTREHFDKYGVFSTGMNDLNDTLWERYTDGHKGYCLGFKTIELCRQMKSSYGYVSYSDDPVNFSFFDKDEDSDLNRLYLKKKSWQYEDEFRFITLGVGEYSTRLQTFNVATISQIILGYNLSPSDEEEIIKIVNSLYPQNLPVFKTGRSKIGELLKTQIR